MYDESENSRVNTSGNQKRIRITVAYDGTDFSGWQFQPDQPTVQGEIEKALEQILGVRARVTGAGRTDAGVHAIGQAAHFDNPGRLSSSEIGRALNAVLPRSVRVRDAVEVSSDFHARYNALWKIYRYSIADPGLPEAVLLGRTHWLRRLPDDIVTLRECCKLILGSHDFFTFSKQESHRERHECLIHEADWNEEDGKLYFEIKGDRFLRGMVRMLVSGMLAMADGKTSLEDFKLALANPGRWKEAVPAPPQGLTLVRVYYAADPE